jgi:hypothetical protein
MTHADSLGSRHCVGRVGGADARGEQEELVDPVEGPGQRRRLVQISDDMVDAERPAPDQGTELDTRKLTNEFAADISGRSSDQ